RDCCHKIEAGCVFSLVFRQRQIGGMRQPHHLQFHFVHGFAPPSDSATRMISARATSSLDWDGQDSTPLSVTRWTVLRSPPMTPLCGETSLATIQSQPLLRSFALACSITFSVSAAK